MSWTCVRGHERLIASFQQVIRRGRLGHAYLLAGPVGIGKRLFAIELAKALLCEAPDASEQLDGCDRCPGCMQVRTTNHPDFQLVGLPEDKHEFPLSLMQELIQHLAYKPARGRYRVAIVDDADDLNEEAANAFLKTLEEPPPRSLLLLLGTSPERQLPTIVSRCQVIRFTPLPADVIADLLLREEVVKSPQEAKHVAELSGGSLGEARLLADPAIGTFRRELFDALSQPRPSSVAIAEKLVRFAEDAGKESAAKRRRAQLGVQFLVELFGAALHIQQGREPALRDPQDVSAARRLATQVSEDSLLEGLERTLRAEYEIDRRLQLVLVLEAVIDSLIAARAT